MRTTMAALGVAAALSASAAATGARADTLDSDHPDGLAWHAIAGLLVTGV